MIKAFRMLKSSALRAAKNREDAFLEWKFNTMVPEPQCPLQYAIESDMLAYLSLALRTEMNIAVISEGGRGADLLMLLLPLVPIHHRTAILCSGERMLPDRLPYENTILPCSGATKAGMSWLLGKNCELAGYDRIFVDTLVPGQANAVFRCDDLCMHFAVAIDGFREPDALLGGLQLRPFKVSAELIRKLDVIVVAAAQQQGKDQQLEAFECRWLSRNECDAGIGINKCDEVAISRVLGHGADEDAIASSKVIAAYADRIGVHHGYALGHFYRIYESLDVAIRAGAAPGSNAINMQQLASKIILEG
jgi:hypothetical protein